MALTILLFFIYTHGLGYSLTRFLKEVSLENTIIRIAIGLGAFPVLGLFFNIINIPLDWRIFLILTNMLPVYDLGKALLKREISFTFSRPKAHIILLLLIFCVHLIVFCFGAFSYPWLEDGDPYEHAAGIKYIAIEKNISPPSGQFHYLNPYPPGYDLWLAILHQTCPSLYTTLKFFNSLIVSLGLLFFFYYVRELSHNPLKALGATFFLAIIPCYLTHFIWAHSLSITLFFPALFLLHKVLLDKRFIPAASFLIAGLFLTQPTQSLKFVIFIILTCIILFLMDRQKRSVIIKVLLLALFISLAWWLPVLKNILSGSSKFITFGSSPIETIDTALSLFSPGGGSATRSYALLDYIFFPKINLINSPTGVGPVFFILALIGIPICIEHISRSQGHESRYPAIILVWLIYTFLGMNTETFHLPFGLFAFRFWLLFSIPVVLLSCETIFFLIHRATKNGYRYSFIAVILLGLLSTAGLHKYLINTSIWSQGNYWDSPDELKGFLWLKDNLKPNSKVFAFSENMLVIGFDMQADYWSKKYKSSFANAINLEPTQLFTRLKNNQFQYLTVTEKDMRVHGKEKTDELLKALDKNTNFDLIYNIPDAFWVYKIL